MPMLVVEIVCYPFVHLFGGTWCEFAVAEHGPVQFLERGKLRSPKNDLTVAFFPFEN